MFDPTHRRLRKSTARVRHSKLRTAVNRLDLEPLEDRRLLTAAAWDQALAAFQGSDLAGKDGPMARVGFDLSLIYAEYKNFIAVHPGLAFVPSTSAPIAISNGSITVDLAASGDAGIFRSQLANLGMTNIVSYGSLVSGNIPIENLDKLAALDTLRVARPSYQPITAAGLVTSQADSALHADDARSLFGVDGTGITVGVMSDSFNALGGMAGDIQTDDLPQSTQVIRDSLVAGMTDEGRAMAQHIHDLAPGANILFATASGGEATFAQNIQALVTAGADIITDDIRYLTEPFFQDGVVALAAQQAVAQGIPFFSAAFNEGTRSYESAFVDSGQTLPSGAKLHDFDPGPGVSTLQEIRVPAGGNVALSFQWDQAFASLGGTGSTSDLDISLLAADGTTVVASSMTANVGGDPLEIINATNTGTDTKFFIRIELVSGPAPGLMKYVDYGRSSTIVTFATDSSTSVGHANTAGVMGVAASAFFGTPEFGVNPPILDDYSSKGGTSILFGTNGQRLATPFNPNAPQVTGVDGANTTFFGSDTSQDADTFPNFFGTSAAAPHLAAVAALMMELTGGPGSSTPDEIYDAMKETAIDITTRSDGQTFSPIPDGEGFDTFSGFGLVNATAAMQAINSGVSIGDDVAQLEGDSGTTSFVFAVNYTGTAVQMVTVAYMTANVTATAGSDYVAQSGTLSFVVGGPTTQFITITVNGDQTVELNETFLLQLSNPVNASIGRASAVGTILNDDIDVSVGDAVVVEGSSGTRELHFPITTFGTINKNIFVSYSTVNGTADGAVDYLPRAGNVVLTPQSSTATIVVPIVTDTLDEDDEQFLVILTGAQGARIADNTGVGTILDDDAMPSFYVNDVQITTTEAGNFAAVFTVGLDAPSGRSVTVNFATVDQGALAGIDYQGLVGALTFAPGQRTRTVAVPITTGASYSPDKKFGLTLSSPLNALLADPTGVATIVFASGPANERIIDNGDTGYSRSNNGWTTLTNTLAYGLDYDYHAAGNGSGTASYTFNGLANGSYQVLAKWIPFSNRATNAPYTILNGATPINTVLVNQQLAPTGEISNGITWQSLGTYDVTTGTLVVRLADNANGYVIADSIRLVPGGVGPQSPEINVAGSGLSIADGDLSASAADGTDFGVTALNTDSAGHTFTVVNNGNAVLNLGGLPRISITGAAANDFLITTQPAASIDPTGSTNFVILFRPTAAGLRQATVTIANNDSDEGPYSFTIQGTGEVVASPFGHNANLPQDVNADARVSTSDVLILVNSLLRNNASPLTATATPAAAPSYFLDVSGDGRVSNSDLLMVVNYILRNSAAPQAAPAAAVSSSDSPAAEPLFANASLSANAVDAAFILFDDTANAVAPEAAPRLVFAAKSNADSRQLPSEGNLLLTDVELSVVLAGEDDGSESAGRAEVAGDDWDLLPLGV